MEVYNREDRPEYVLNNGPIDWEGKYWNILMFHHREYEMYSTQIMDALAGYI